MEIRCLRCNCLPSECRINDAQYDCPNCISTQCDCWAENNGDT